jgi:hypothetical protein
MGENHQENLLKCLRQWHDITLKQSDVLSSGDLEQFERLNRVSIVLQNRFQTSLDNLVKPVLSAGDRALLEEISACQSRFIDELKKGADEMSRVIGTLRKNRASLAGYRQNSPALPRYKSERT